MVATTDATQPSGSNDVVLTAAQRAELALDEVDVDGTGTVSETRGLLDSALNVLVKIQDALGPHHTVTPARIIDGQLDLSVNLSEFVD